ncbi:MAG: hypothetical protein V7703_03410, partial [Hyphomicrobiales bacterium]
SIRRSLVGMGTICAGSKGSQGVVLYGASFHPWREPTIPQHRTSVTTSARSQRDIRNKRAAS